MLRGLPAFPPLRAVFNDPIGQRALESDVVPGFLGLDPFMAQNFFALGLKFAVERRIFHEVIAVGIVCVARHRIV